ncbi:MAG TPA: RDD family protein [Pirellulales bacterium]|jgi:uncharacterized RDD family membrane protein YckC
MATEIQFETPENVQISYRPAGPGTRFIAWFMDTMLMMLVVLVLIVVALIAGASVDILDRERAGNSSRAVLYFVGLVWLVYSLGNLLYFGCCELFMRGQTFAKRSMRIRVVKADGFSLDPMAIFLRTMFRIIDHMPMFYIVPLLTAKGQRLGDLVAGTVVVADEPAELGGLRDQLSGQKTTESRFQFDATVLKRARPQDIQAVEKILERWSNLDEAGRRTLLERVVPALAARLKVEQPPEADWFTFLRDLLAAEYRRQHRKLG